MSTRFERAAKQRYFQAFLAEDPRRAAETTGGATLSRVTNNVTKLEQDYLAPAIALIKDSISIVIYAIVLASVTDPWFAALMVAASLAALFLPRLQRRRLASTASTYMDTLAGYTSRTEELLASRTELPSASHRAIGLTHWRAAGTVRGDRYRYGLAKSLADGISGTGTELVLLVAFVASGWACLTGHMTVGAVAATLGYAKAFISPLTDMLLQHQRHPLHRQHPRRLQHHGAGCGPYPRACAAVTRRAAAGPSPAAAPRRLRRPRAAAHRPGHLRRRARPAAGTVRLGKDDTAEIGLPGTPRRPPVPGQRRAHCSGS